MKDYEMVSNSIQKMINTTREMMEDSQRECIEFIDKFIEEFGKDDGEGGYTLKWVDDEGNNIPTQLLMVTIDGGSKRWWSAITALHSNRAYYTSGVYFSTEEGDYLDIRNLSSDEIMQIAEHLINYKYDFQVEASYRKDK